ncbi:MAG: hypothetical protein COW24_04880 [Candidatus Kerfeldbacteria bacterium CG15_BIG_FIL_POST_REV_8_21_14_020_45_12]|uniref:Nucleotidyl transferase domain-containing protein n=1 Tax=Candidatus Kerfeldbacteria bacterium CG15_BIG_FIL_POST_REV_8_21_14_020_45_12 TaxID=2014247 RepID=A0A2M7H2P5_9BACT|nr:MAG: hypothetical protein COW24_04880 [Candidatus Kerfeldbacteria bacterium CG15_BIG_FIL_POST_REV_8_21_14_020_45_12]PJA93250.1 MAG: hypothetical protein CO132_04040 [Candidatus Kerfeldbacteria bacterium CG_4_9_14_3_um_filter_45_8]
MAQNSGKARITITLRNDLLTPLDNFVDGEKIRNRSHAIEYILTQHLGLGIKRAVILAGADSDTGKVTALTRVKNRPVIAYVLDTLRLSGIRDVVLVLDDKGDELKDYLGDGSQWGIHLTVVQDDQTRGTAAALALAESLLDEAFLLLYSDMLVDLNLTDFVDHHKQAGAVGTVALTYIRSAGKYGVARLEGGKIANYEEKPGAEALHGLVNAGVYLFEPSVFEYINDDTRSLEKEVLPKMAADGKLAGYPFQGKWFDVSNEKGLELAKNDW